MYVLKICYQWLLPPGGILLLLLGLAWYMFRQRQRGRWYLLAVCGVLYVLSLRLGAWLLVAPLEQAIPQPDDVTGDVIVMLGNGSLADAPDIDGTGQPSGTMAKNMLAALRMQRQTGLPLIVSGGEVYAFSGNESAIAAREFRSLGLQEADVTYENRSRTTAENLRYTQNILHAHGWTNPIIAVVALQAPRTALLAEHMGMQAQTYPTHYRAAQTCHLGGPHDLVPSAAALDDSAAALKAYLGIIATWAGVYDEK